jgi:plexin A
MSDSCGMCLALPEKFNCGWCSSSNSCEVEEQCSKPSETKMDWLNRAATCPNPEIHGFEPKTGPWEGGTNITIKGINLGKNFNDIYSNVKIAGIDCMPYKDLYVDTKEIVCMVDGPGVQTFRKGKIVVQISDYRGESKEDFEFIDPKIDDFYPKFGPVSGGTQLRIEGKYLNAGSRILAYIDDLACEILSTDETQAVCRTAPADRKIKGKLKMQFDSGSREYSGDLFEYVDDPLIEYSVSGPNLQVKVPKGKNMTFVLFLPHMITNFIRLQALRLVV